MNIVVCVKQVADINIPIELDKFYRQRRAGLCS